jgi:hypothetical protein
MAEMTWPVFAMSFDELELHGYLAGKPRATLDAMIKNGINAPPASSCGRLFDAVAAALDICRERQAYEGEAAARLEAMVDEDTLRNEDDSLGYPLSIPNLRGSELRYIEPLAMWECGAGRSYSQDAAPPKRSCRMRGCLPTTAGWRSVRRRLALRISSKPITKQGTSPKEPGHVLGIPGWIVEIHVESECRCRSVQERIQDRVRKVFFTLSKIMKIINILYPLLRLLPFDRTCGKVGTAS